MNNLKKASNYYRSAAEALLKKWAPSYSDLENRLNEIGLTPIPHGENDSFVGSGIQAQAYEVLYNGKRAIAKVIARELAKDVVPYVTMQKLIKIMPREYARHFAEVYDIIEDEELGYIIVMEMLFPVDVGTFTVNFAKEEFDPDFFKNKVYIMAKNMLFNKDEGKKAVAKVILKLYPELGMSKALKISNKCEPEIDAMFEVLLDYDKIDIIEQFNALAKNINKFLPNNINKEHTSRFSLFMREFLEETFPNDSKKSRNVHGNEKLEKLLRALDFIKNEYNIDWYDTHGDNIMQKPNGDLAIIDYGLFDV